MASASTGASFDISVSVTLDCRLIEVGSTRQFVETNKAIEARDIHPVMDRRFAFDEAKAALEYLEQGKHFGKVVITF